MKKWYHRRIDVLPENWYLENDEKECNPTGSKLAVHKDESLD
jgi:hypothetical protein